MRDEETKEMSKVNIQSGAGYGRGMNTTLPDVHSQGCSSHTVHTVKEVTVEGFTRFPISSVCR